MVPGFNEQTQNTFISMYSAIEDQAFHETEFIADSDGVLYVIIEIGDGTVLIVYRLPPPSEKGPTYTECIHSALEYNGP